MALKLDIKQADADSAEVLKGMKEENERMVKALEKTWEMMVVRAQKIAEKEQELVISFPLITVLAW